MSRIAIIYFSGTGNTKAVAECIYRAISGSVEAHIISVEKLPEDFCWGSYTAVIIGTPTYHSEPARPMMDFIRTADPPQNIPAFLFTTCGMYPENCLRKLALECERRGIITVAHSSYRCAATDGILLMPGMKLWHSHEKHLREKIMADTDDFLRRLSKGAARDMPRYKWYAPLNYPNRMMGKAVKLPIHLHKESCVGCGKCAGNCPQLAIVMKDGCPQINKDSCINCYRCIHHCPALALSLSKRRRVTAVWQDTI